ncbi:hypothetical protein AB0H43_26050 [Hamadaea sp. NPDC050747]|uniref:hypothetical protein n=1 Tax=Hamadaea sp. NPDC050747 TaxID=3155789 RepID=UPI0033CDD86E
MNPTRCATRSGRQPGRGALEDDPARGGAGSYEIEWFDVINRETIASEVRQVESDGAVEFSSPFPSGPVAV